MKNNQNTSNESISKMLHLVGKAGCDKSKEMIEDILGEKNECDDNENDIIQFTQLDEIRGQALYALRKNHIQKVSKNSHNYDKFSKKIKEFRDSLKKSCELMNDKIIKNFLLDKANNNQEVSPKIVINSYSDTYDKIRKLVIEMEAVLYCSPLILKIS